MTMGMDETTGRSLEGSGHILQSVLRILRTPRGGHVLARNFGSEIFELIDSPLNASTILRISSRVTSALMRQEPRIRVSNTRVVEAGADGGVEVSIVAVERLTGAQVLLDGVRL